VTRWIRTAEALAELARSFEGCRTIGLDTESDSLYHHFEKVCLIQIATDRGEAVLVDSLAVKDLSPLGPALADPDITKVLHGADYDVTTLKRDFGFTFASLFDTMIAARFLGMPGIGLAAVAEAELGITLSKANQKDDWSRRPVTPQQEAYALADVQHLGALRERLEAKLAEKRRLEWVREECEVVAALEPQPRRQRRPTGRPSRSWATRCCGRWRSGVRAPSPSCATCPGCCRGCGGRPTRSSAPCGEPQRCRIPSSRSFPARPGRLCPPRCCSGRLASGNGAHAGRRS
jgi:ribonuclease D